jgi:hypothetical protein
MTEPEYNGYLPKTPEDLAGLLPDLQALAVTTFGRLDPALEPSIHLVSVPVGLVEMDEAVEWFSRAGVQQMPSLVQARKFSFAILPDGTRVPAIFENRFAGVWGFDHEAVRDAVANRVSELEAQTPRTSFISSFRTTTEEGHAIGVVLRVDSAGASRYGGAPAPDPSFFRELTIAFLEGCETYIRDRAQAAPAGLDLPHARQLVRVAATNLIARVFADLSVDVPVGAFLDQMDAIAAATYEHAESRGRLLIQAHEIGADALQFQQPVPLADTRAARKLLEMSSERLALASDGDTASGLLSTDPNFVEQGSAAIDFCGRHRWELRLGHQILVRVEAGVPDLPRPQMRREAFEATWVNTFGTPPADPDLVWSIVESAMHQRHGALVVFSIEADAEARRLGGASTAITPALLGEALVKAVSSVDGAILFGVDGRCHAVGVILDGLVTEGGRTGRGSRYNSTLRYIDTRAREGARAVAVIISEEGSVEAVGTATAPMDEGALPA